MPATAPPPGRLTRKAHVLPIIIPSDMSGPRSFGFSAGMMMAGLGGSQRSNIDFTSGICRSPRLYPPARLNVAVRSARSSSRASSRSLMIGSSNSISMATVRLLRGLMPISKRTACPAARFRYPDFLGR
jgi:hypothetical protein